ncbi:PAS domain S-box protein [Geopsychrobacter electrodiphilus]|uniref:PAS domain S-box protein n=1 Tax=Geopsychrobacter electrodiphilus TaxID=225196 RepID=UPI00037698E9|nr:PAS domain S-box protein [Geopsychrobacter electrodiphilus]
MAEIEQQYKAMFENMAQGAFFVGGDGYPFDVNPAALVMLGLTRDQFMGRVSCDSAWQMITKDGTILGHEHYPSVVALRTGQPVRDFMAGVFVPHRNQYVWLKINAIPVLKESCDRPDQVFVTLHDISRQKRMNEVHAARLLLMQFALSHSLEELLVETLDQLENLTGSTIGFYHFYDETTKIITLKEWSTRTATEFCHMDGLEGHYSLDEAGVWADCVRTRQPIVHNDYAALTHRSDLPEGHASVIRELVVPVKRHDRIVAIMGVGNKPQDYSEADIETVSLFADLAWDIAEHKLADEVLRQSELKFKGLFESSPDAVFLTIPDGRITDCNPAACEMFGWTREEMLQRTRAGILDESDPRLPMGLQERQQAGKVQGYEITAIRKNGEKFPVEVDSVVFDQDNASSRSFVIMRDISARKRAQEELQVYKNITSNSEDLVSLVDRNYRYRMVNEAYLRLHNKSHREIVGHTVVEMIGERAFKEIVKAQIDRCLAGEIVRYQTWIDFPQAGRRCFDLAYTPYVENGSIAGVTVAGRDITEIKKVEEQYQYTQAILQAAMDQSPAGIAIAEAPDGRLSYVNDAGLLIRGSDRQTVVDGVGLDQYVASWQLLDLDGRPLTTDEVPLARAVLFGETCHREFIIRRDQGDDHIVSANAAPIKNEAGEVTAAIVVFTDITEQKHAEGQTRNLTQRLLLATSSAKLGIWDWDIPENSMIWDERMFELYGIRPEESPNNVDAWMNGLHPEDKEAAVAACQAAVNGGPEFDTAFRVCHPDGKVRHLKANALVVRGADGQAERMIGINADITDQKLAENERERLESQLLQAQKIESIGQLAGGVAHDFNNMLGVILGHAEMALRKEGQGKCVTTNLEQIRLAAKRSADLTRQLLTFARKQTITPKILDLNDTVAGTLKMLQRLIGENIRLSWSPKSDLWTTKVDPSQMDQILANLCVNARDAIAGSGNISIQTGNASIDKAYCMARPYELYPGDYVQLSVSDDGCGMPKEVQDHIFEPFFTTKEIGYGTGLGLATVYGAVKQNHGFITLYSEPGVGTTFNIYFPREMDAAETPASPQEQELAGGTETILLVEDDEMLLQMGMVMLEGCGYQVLPASSAGAALALVQKHPGAIALLISDVIMPGMNGRELSEKILALHPEIKVLFVSGYTADIISKQGIVDNYIHFLQKPVSLETFAGKVREVLDQI